MPVHWDQAEYDFRCEWGLAGVKALAPISEILIVVDVLVFSTAVDIAVALGASVLPYRWRDASAEAFAQSKGALLASARSAGGYSLSPPSLRSLPAGAALVLPSPNGSTLCLAAGGTTTYTACLRNYQAVANHARTRGSRIAVVPAGEQWGDGGLRPAIEDLIGAGAVLACLPGRPSPEAETAIAVFEHFRHNLHDALLRSTSGKELAERGFACDVEVAGEYAVSSAAPVMQKDRFVSSARIA
jgi:2-phosphosulfolactate phosphatase